jgi:plastocyanin
VKNIRFVVALSACVLLAVATASGGAALARPDTKAHPSTMRVSIVTDRHTTGQYKPRTVTVHLGDRIVFRNVSNAPHTVTADKGRFDSGTIFVGKSWTYTARKIGTFTYFCQFHAGMHGTIIVKRPSRVPLSHW